MIVTDSTPPSPPKGAPPQPAPYRPAPPSYQASGSQYQPTQPLIYTTVPAVHPLAHGYNARRRFLKAFLVAILIWALIGMFIRSVAELAYWNSRHGRYTTQAIWPDDFAVPAGIDPHRCVTDWQEVPSGLPLFPSHATTTFDVPYDLDTMLFLARGPAGGTFTVVTSDEVRDTARVVVVVSYRHQEFRDQAKVCRIKRGESSAGIGIFTPRWNYTNYPRERGLAFSVVVSLPTNSHKKPLDIKNFEADMPLFGISTANLHDSVSFTNISLISSQMHITAQSLVAENAFLKTSNAPISGSIYSPNLLHLITSNGAITGTFNTSKSLHLITSNALIQADVGLTNEGNHPTKAILKTSNGQIRSAISLLRDTEGSVGGVYDVEAFTSNAPLNINFPTAPVDSTLSLDAKTTNAGADVSLHPTYEGRFELVSSLFAPVVEKSTVNDPSGRGRERTIQYSSLNRGVLSGKVQWAGSDKSDGRVLVKSSNAKVTLKL
ncbi:hypothetical protein CCMSSC00406_0008886 [Pleurotus cornucopiae]|uniref:Uncharacterized protein n=1 Tax=Pleurotus cornucopiae TaxID=5321 RepID=A0ACB7ISV2_PLECO|nr:hypothetical protein CCMSSC00406_0008886 [Pleurotus cornucopiae]